MRMLDIFPNVRVGPGWGRNDCDFNSVVCRVNQNPALLTFAILFYRWHNVLAQRLQVIHNITF